jgi:hypothetical protein
MSHVSRIVATHLIRMRGAHEYDRAFFRHLPAAPGMHLSEEELHQYRECPEEGIVDVFVHDRKGLLALLFAVVRHVGV